MPIEVIMPQLGESVVEGTVTRWLKQEGDPIEEFEPLVEINTDKVDTEVPAPAGGTLLALYVEEGQTVAAGTLLAVIGEKGEQVPPHGNGQTDQVAMTEAPETIERTQQTVSGRTQPAAGRTKELGFISPVVARIAAEHNVDLTQVEGSGRAGRITKKDILAFVEKPPTQAAPAPWEEPASGELFRPSEEVFGAKKRAPRAKQAGELLPHTAVRRAIAEHMLRSKHTSPHVTTVMEADLSRVVAHRQANKAAFAHEGLNLTFSAYFAASAVEALKEIPIVNSSWREDGILLHPNVNLGMAVSLGEQGLIVPVIREADQRSLRGLARAIQDLAERARAKKLEPDEVQGGTFTITNHGISGSLFATPVINQPQCAILGVGIIQKRVVVVESADPSGNGMDSIAIRPMVYISLTFDHRILDGAVGDGFLARVVQKLEEWT